MMKLSYMVVQPLMRKAGGVLIYVLLISSIACSIEKVDRDLVIYGIIKNVSDGAPANAVPLKLTVFKNFYFDHGSGLIPFNEVYSAEVESSGKGFYSFNVPYDKISESGNGTFSIATLAENLVLIDQNRENCTEAGIVWSLIRANRAINFDVGVDHPTFLKVKFDKLDHFASDIVWIPSCKGFTFETTWEDPDTTFLRTYAFHPMQAIHQFQYFVRGVNGDQEHLIDGIQFQENDTTKILIEY